MRRLDGRLGEHPAERPLLDRLFDADPENLLDPPVSAAESHAQLCRSVHRDVEALLNARRPWRSVPDRLSPLQLSPLGYGMPDFAAGAFNDRRQKETLRTEVENTIRRFEPRLTEIQVHLVGDGNMLGTTLQLRIQALLRVRPAPEPILFDTLIDTTTSDVTLSSLYGN